MFYRPGFFIMLRYFHLFGLAIPMFNLLIGIGISLAMLFLQYDRSFQSADEKYRQTIHLGLFLSLLVGIVGAFLLDAYTQHIPVRFSNLRTIGLTFWGGLILGFICLVIYLKIMSLPVNDTLNLLTMPFCIAHGFGRIGCFCAGCCFGKPTMSCMGVVFPNGSLPYLHYGQDISIFPTQLFESGFVLLLFLFFLFSKSKIVLENRWLIYLVTYAVFRFCIEYIRADNRGVLGPQSLFSPSQIISLAVFIIIVPVLIYKIIAKDKLRPCP